MSSKILPIFLLAVITVSLTEVLPIDDAFGQTTTGGDQGLGGTTNVPNLDDVGKPTVDDFQSPQPAPILTFDETGRPTGTTSGQSLGDVLRNLFEPQLSTQTGEIVSGQSRTVADDLRDLFQGNPSPETIAGEQRTERQQTLGVQVVTTIQNFFINLFG